MIPQRPHWIQPDDPASAFPDVEFALREPDGLLAAGGDLSSERLLAAYRRGIFPWYSANQPVLWWSPDPRTVLFPAQPKLSRSLRKTLRRERFSLSLDRDFRAVIAACAEPRGDDTGTWITQEMAAAYTTLHDRGHAHSVECRLDGELVGGLYGVAIGRVFFGESMFSRVPDASKVAFAWLLRQLDAWNFGLVDCQIYTPHLASLGAVEIPRAEFIRRLDTLCSSGPPPGHWHFDTLENNW